MEVLIKFKFLIMVVLGIAFKAPLAVLRGAIPSMSWKSITVVVFHQVVGIKPI